MTSPVNAYDLIRDTSPLDSVRSTINLSSLDWAAAGDTAWIYGIVSGWDCEEGHEHDEICGGQEAIAVLAAIHRWDPARVARLRSLRVRWREIQRDAAIYPAASAQLERVQAANAQLRAENIALLTRLAFSEAGNPR